MIDINILPWREQARSFKLKVFLISWVCCLLTVFIGIQLFIYKDKQKMSRLVQLNLKSQQQVVLLSSKISLWQFYQKTSQQPAGVIKLVLKN